MSVLVQFVWNMLPVIGVESKRDFESNNVVQRLARRAISDINTLDIFLSVSITWCSLCRINRMRSPKPQLQEHNFMFLSMTLLIDNVQGLMCGTLAASFGDAEDSSKSVGKIYHYIELTLVSIRDELGANLCRNSVLFRCGKQWFGTADHLIVEIIHLRPAEESNTYQLKSQSTGRVCRPSVNVTLLPG